MRKKNEVTPKKIPLWGKVLIILLVIVLAFIGFSYGMIRHFTGDSLGFRGILAMAGYGGFPLPEGYCHFVLGDSHTYENLPQILVGDDGKEVATQEEYDVRRRELLQAYEKYMYGPMPKEGFQTNFEIVETGEAWNGKALRQQVKITVSTEKGNCESLLLLYLPKGRDNCGVFLGENFSGNTAVTDDPAVLPSPTQSEDTKRGSEAESWPLEEIIDRGYGVATMLYSDWAADDMETYRERLLDLFDTENVTAFTAWAFGYSRALDYLCQLPEINQDAIATVGHSRIARVSLWAGAQDERIDMVTASCGGGSLRSDVAGRIVTDGTSNHWFTEQYFQFEGRDEEIPVDMNVLYALTADRHLYISMGATDLASDPLSMVDMLQDAKQVWSKIYGIDVIDDVTYYDLKPDTAVMSPAVGMHVHTGGHMMNAFDWSCYMDYMDKYVTGGKNGKK